MAKYLFDSNTLTQFADTDVVMNALCGESFWTTAGYSSALTALLAKGLSLSAAQSVLDNDFPTKVRVIDVAVAARAAELRVGTPTSDIRLDDLLTVEASDLLGATLLTPNARVHRAAIAAGVPSILVA